MNQDYISHVQSTTYSLTTGTSTATITPIELHNRRTKNNKDEFKQTNKQIIGEPIEANMKLYKN